MTLTSRFRWAAKLLFFFFWCSEKDLEAILGLDRFSWRDLDFIPGFVNLLFSLMSDDLLLFEVLRDRSGSRSKDPSWPVVNTEGKTAFEGRFRIGSLHLEIKFRKFCFHNFSRFKLTCIFCYKYIWNWMPKCVQCSSCRATSMEFQARHRQWSAIFLHRFSESNCHNL